MCSCALHYLFVAFERLGRYNRDCNIIEKALSLSSQRDRISSSSSSPFPLSFVLVAVVGVVVVVVVATTKCFSRRKEGILFAGELIASSMAHTQERL